MSREEVPVALPVLAAFPHAQLVGKTSFYQMISTLAYLSCSANSIQPTAHSILFWGYVLAYLFQFITIEAPGNRHAARRRGIQNTPRMPNENDCIQWMPRRSAA